MGGPLLITGAGELIWSREHLLSLHNGWAWVPPTQTSSRKFVLRQRENSTQSKNYQKLKPLNFLKCTCPLCYCVKPLAFSAACLFLPSQNGKNLPKYLLTSVLWNVFFWDMFIPQVYHNFWYYVLEILSTLCFKSEATFNLKKALLLFLITNLAYWQFKSLAKQPKCIIFFWLYLFSAEGYFIVRS